MIDRIRKLWSLFDRMDRRNAMILLAMMLVGACLEVVGVAAVPAFISAFLDPERIRQYELGATVMDGLGLHTAADVVVWGGLMLIAVFALKSGFLLFSLYLQQCFVAKRRIGLSRRLGNAYLHAPYAFHLAHNSAEIIRNADREVTMVANQVMFPLLSLATRSLMLIFIIGFLFVMEPVVTLFWMVFLGAIGAVGVLLVSKRLKRYGEIGQQSGRQLLKALQQSSGSFKEMRVAGRESYFAELITAAVARVAHTQRRKQLISRAVTPTLEVFSVTGLLGLAMWLVLSGRPTEDIIVTLSLFVVGLVRLRETLTVTLTNLTDLRYSLVSVDPVYRHLRELEPLVDSAGTQTVTPAPIVRALSLRDVWYRYRPDLPHALKGIDVTIEKGSSVAFVGSSGAGKSTLVDLVLGLIEPERGSVLVDGTPITTVGLRRWRAAIGYVPQAIYLTDDTIRRNIAFGIRDGQIDEERVRRAVEMAQLSDFVARLDKGLDTRVGERGVRMSGGERQRTAIARALYNDPEILIFDEATSALDNTTERALVAAVDALKGTRTVIIVAHRLSTVKNCDVVHFMKDGRIEASGGYDEVAESHPEFRLMATG